MNCSVYNSLYTVAHLFINAEDSEEFDKIASQSDAIDSEAINKIK